MSYFEFPHTRSYDGDLGYIIKRLDELTQKYGEFMEYNQIKFADPLDWNINSSYIAWNIVFDTASRGYYISLKPVPAGVSIENTDYWELIIPFKVDNTINIESYNPVSNHAVAQGLTSVQNSVSNVSRLLQAEGQARESADTELSTRIGTNADNIATLSGNLTHETTARETFDNNIAMDVNALTARVDNIAQTITPGSTSGDIELADIRVGANGITYPNAGDAVRGQYNELNTDLELINVNDVIIPSFELGAIAFSTSSISFQTSTTAIRTPQLKPVRVKARSKISLTNYDDFKFKVAVLRDSDSKYDYTSYLQTDYYVVSDGVAFIVIAYEDDTTITDIDTVRKILRIDNNIIYENDELYSNIKENNAFIPDAFMDGSSSTANFKPPYNNGKAYRVGNPKLLTFNYDVMITAKTGFRFYTGVNHNGIWSDLGWLTSLELTAGDLLALTIARTTEDTSEIADVEEFVSNVNINTVNISTVDSEKISEYMEHFYYSDSAEAYLFFTDPHVMGVNGSFNAFTFKSMMDNIKDTFANTSAQYVVCGGDWLNSGDTIEQAAVKLGYVAGQMRSYFPDCYYPIVGNHDFNYLGVDENNQRLSESDWVSNNAMHNFWFSDFEHCYYKFKKNVALNYVLNTRTDYNGTNAYDQTMITWLANNLISDNPAHATIMMHLYVTSGTNVPTRVEAVGAIIAAFNAHAVCELNETDHGMVATFDFTNTTGHIDYVLAGHNHADYEGTLGGVPLILTINTTANGQFNYDMIFADYTNHKLYLTRFGYGSSREIDI